MAVGTSSEGNAYYRCERCGEYKEDFRSRSGDQSEPVAKIALREHMVSAHNKGN